jgi:hypothetical protein
MTSWSFGGTALSTFGKVKLINDYLDVAARRGGNQVIPFRHGTAFSAKYYDERKIDIGIAMYSTSAQSLEASFDSLKNLISPRTEGTLSVTLEDSSTRTALASVDNVLNAERKSATQANVVIEFILCRPFFRGSSLIADNTTTINTSPKAMTVINTGTIEERDPIITMVGPLANTVISNTTTNVSMTYGGTISAGGTVVIQTDSFGQYTALLGGSTNVIGNITHNGAAALMVLAAGTNTLSVTDSTATTGTIKISFYPPYL